MTYRVFQYPIPAPPELADLNQWLASHRVVSVQHHVVQQAAGAMLVFIVQTVDGKMPVGESSRPKVDYKQVLDAETFARFSKLREERKKIGNEEGVPLYAIFTNEQLAAMAQAHPASQSTWKKIDGIGDARMKKYGQRMMACLNPQDKNHHEH